MPLISSTCSVDNAGDVSIGFIFWASAPYVLSGAVYFWCYGFLVFCYCIGAGLILHILALIYIHIFWYNPISWLYRSIISLPNLL